MFALHVARRYLLSNPSQTLLLIAGVALGVTVWFFLTPIIYPITMLQNEDVRNLFLLNPMHSFVSLYREIVLQGQVHFIYLQIIIPVSLITYFFVGWVLMKIKQAFGDVL